MAKSYWLLKTEPEEWSWHDQEAFQRHGRLDCDRYLLGPVPRSEPAHQAWELEHGNNRIAVDLRLPEILSAELHLPVLHEAHD